MRIEVQQLNKRYRSGTHALREVDFVIEPGMFGLLGPNGAGKTSLMRILATLIKPSSGDIRIDGESLLKDGQQWLIRSQLGYLPQDLALYGNLSAYEFLDYVAQMKQLRTSRKEQIERVLHVTNLSDVAQKHIKTFSGGMKRRVGVAQALLGDPKLLIVDEPTAGLDPQERVRFRNLLVELAHERTVILSSHIIEDIAQTCSNIAILYAGQLAFHGTTQQLLEQAQQHVWEFSAPSYIPGAGATLVTSTPYNNQFLYRVVAPNAPAPDAIPVAPRLEDAYLWQSTQRTYIREHTS